ncbi:glycoside hydrolase family 3 N-terminal domain-containing protein [Candidatus Pelagibacter sp. Uisw_099_02]|uniref:glycoside hydrolase family 3 N-terminal domain-containing protein n=1 Tax=Candidatus Pelagibacter sp. Uisw_099_02 TaxID=3230981 RepID=UPI00236E93BB|nr:glycoside hydrolase family 3 N-terminal domain-containing protein [Candidatus Pelagibacter sp.]
MINRRSLITGIKSTTLSVKERKFLQQYKPWGVILFSRNITSLKQTKELTNQIKRIFKDKNYPILIDQEGGRVNRFKKIFNADSLTSEFFGKLYMKDKKKFYAYYKIFIKQTSFLLKSIGVNINTLPVLDLRVKGSSSIIGDRSFSKDPKIVSQIGDICINNFHSNNIGTVIKHIPGHGLAKVDSHELTPKVNKDLEYLLKNDFSTFKKKSSFFAMTAHIIYTNIDKTNTATHSKKIIKLIRNNIKFKNIIMSDDISMKSLKNSIKVNTLRAFDAGCDLVLHCNGNIKEMHDVAINSPLISNFIIKKTSQFYKIIS